MITRPTTRVPLSGTTAKLMARMTAPTSTAERIPPRLSTASSVSLTWLGMNLKASGKATTINGMEMRKTEPHQNFERSRPATRGPRAAMAPPVADHRAMHRVRPGPLHSAVMSDSVVG